MSWTVAGFKGRRGCNDNADVFRADSQKKGCWCGQAEGRLAGTGDPRRMDRRFGVKTGMMEGGLFPVIKKTPKERSG